VDWMLCRRRQLHRVHVVPALAKGRLGPRADSREHSLEASLRRVRDELHAQLM
jgi:hypothetical protein